MIAKTFLTTTLIAGGIWYSGSYSTERPSARLDSNLPVAALLFEMGEQKPDHFIAPIQPELALKGKEIIETGRTTDANGKKTSKQSRHFVCTNCHNTKREDPDLSVSDPEARLKYVSAINLPLLPATTLHGVVNRESWYNDDYAKKYGALVLPARNNLKEAIQVCATQCSQGRALDAFEMEAVLHYLWSIQLTIGDLNFRDHISEADTLAYFYQYAKTMGNADKSNTEADESFRTSVKRKYLQASPAHFVSDQGPNGRSYGKNGNPVNGELIYEFACMSCHKNGGVTNFKFDKEKNTFRFLKRHMKRREFFSVYHHVLNGTYAKPGYRPYMPNYTRERLSEQQLEDLVSYIHQQAEK
ncbi:MAG TPA: hypothetical protein DCD96_02825 [Flavobacteriales bacterium]|nr:hypothetical protein [Flavobacteriales bacterium]HRE74605.1 cytochrome c [Flavobacteriales bacterium]HRJ34756.1 cytochrome c [Flavobacteriales bacterium]HRJ39989.1 cytochrome c [Flavobacteriales bacterium]